jgi:hypothetical protein
LRTTFFVFLQAREIFCHLLDKMQSSRVINDPVYNQLLEIPSLDPSDTKDRLVMHLLAIIDLSEDHTQRQAQHVIRLQRRVSVLSANLSELKLQLAETKPPETAHETVEPSKNHVDLAKASLVNTTDAQIADLSNRIGVLIEENSFLQTSLKQALEMGELNLQSLAQERREFATLTNFADSIVHKSFSLLENQRCEMNALRLENSAVGYKASFLQEKLAAENSAHFETRLSLEREKITAAMDAAEASATATGAAASLQVALEEISRLKGENAVYEGLLTLAMQSEGSARNNLLTDENLEIIANVVF